MKNNLFGKSIKGNYRKTNEDNFICLTNEKIKLYAICDGMGGYKFGKLASSILIKELQKRFNNYNFKNFNQQKSFDWLEESIYIIFNVMLEHALKDLEKLNMGVTCLLALEVNNNIYSINIGDCRLYIYNLEGILRQITKDQNLLNEIGWERCNKNPRIAKLLTSALGPNKKIKIDKYTLLNPKGYLLFSSDGFHDYATDLEIKKIISSNENLKIKVDNLIHTAINNLSTDNITVLLLKL